MPRNWVWSYTRETLGFGGSEPTVCYLLVKCGICIRFIMGSPLVPTSTIVCWIFINIILSFYNSYFSSFNLPTDFTHRSCTCYLSDQHSFSEGLGGTRALLLSRSQPRSLSINRYPFSIDLPPKRPKKKEERIAKNCSRSTITMIITIYRAT